jgi:hypothetical protein
METYKTKIREEMFELVIQARDTLPYSEEWHAILKRVDRLNFAPVIHVLSTIPEGQHIYMELCVRQTVLLRLE